MKGKKKILTVLMTGVVLLIWGKLIFDFFSLQKNTVEQYSIPNSSAELVYENLAKFDYHVVVDYRDPFLGKRAVKKSNKKKATIPTKKKEIIKVESNIKWPNITYKGLMNNRSQKQGIGIFEINGKEALMKIGEVKYQLTLIKMAKDSVEFSFQEELKTIKK